MKSTNVTVVATSDDLGVIGVSKNNEEYGYIKVEQVAPTFAPGGWARIQKRTALIKGKVADLQQLELKAGEQIPGKIVIKESFIPFQAENSDRDLKIAGESGVICRVDDEPIYRQTFFTPNLNEQDDLIQHNNTEEIREALAAIKEMNGMISEQAGSGGLNIKL